MVFRIIRNDITKVTADAIVNTANPKPVYGSGTDMAIYRAAGEEKLLEARKKIGEIKPGEAAVTDAFDLDAKYIIHTVGPEWLGGVYGEREILHACYRNALLLADQLHCKSVAFPLIASGSNEFPKHEALDIALSEIGKFLLNHQMEVSVVVFDEKSLTLSQTIMAEIEQFIDEHTVEILREAEYEPHPFSGSRPEMRRRAFANSRFHSSGASVPLPYEEYPCEDLSSLVEFVRNKGQSFKDKLLELIDRSGMKESQVYNKANINRQVFSSIMCKENYNPSKRTVIAFALALELDLDTMQELLASAGYSLKYDKFDIVISHFVSHKRFNILEIDEALYRLGLPTFAPEK